MDIKDKTDACIKLAEMGGGRWENRQTYEWKVTLLVWAGFLTGAKFAHEARVHVPIVLSASVGLVFLLLYGFVWLRGIWTANDNDKEWDIFYRKAVESIVDDLYSVASPPQKKTKQPLYKFLEDYSSRFQISMTALIIVISIAIMDSKSSGTDQYNPLQAEPGSGGQPIRSHANGTSPS